TLNKTMGQSSAAPMQALVSYLDKNKTTHLAWIEEPNPDDFRIKYGKLTEAGVYSEQSISHDPLQLIWSLKMVVDDSGTAHLVWQGRRDNVVGCCESGNYAIYYASSAGGSSQISS